MDGVVTVKTIRNGECEGDQNPSGAVDTRKKNKMRISE